MRSFKPLPGLTGGHRRGIAAILGSTLIAALGVSPTAAASTTATGPSTTTGPYVLPVADSVHITSLPTVGESGAASNGYEMVGIPDGSGLIRQGANLVAYLNHELRDNLGIVRRHGQRGAFVSRFVIDPATFRVMSGSDWINPGTRYWDYPSGTYVTTGATFVGGAVQDLAFGRFCSGTLSDPGAFYNGATGAGWKGQIYFANEEDGDDGRVSGVTKEGDATALPRLGLFSWENAVPASNQSDTTLVMGQEDGLGDGSQPWVYVGRKQRSGEPVVKAGLTNGTDFVVDALDSAVTNDAQWRATYAKGTPAPVGLVEIDWDQTGAGPERPGQVRRPEPQSGGRWSLGSPASERLLLLEDRRRGEVRIGARQPRRWWPVAPAVRRCRGSRCRSHADPSAGWQRGGRPR